MPAPSSLSKLANSLTLGNRSPPPQTSGPPTTTPYFSRRETEPSQTTSVNDPLGFDYPLSRSHPSGQSTSVTVCPNCSHVIRNTVPRTGRPILPPAEYWSPTQAIKDTVEQSLKLSFQESQSRSFLEGRAEGKHITAHTWRADCEAMEKSYERLVILLMEENPPPTRDQYLDYIMKFSPNQEEEVRHESTYQESLREREGELEG